PDGSRLVYSTYLGGSGDDRAFAIIAGAGGDAFVAGGTLSSDFPLLDAIQAECQKEPTGACSEDAFVAILDPKGTLEFGSYLGGGGSDEARGIAIDDGAVYLAGASTPSATATQFAR